jgi:hypothetical protein
MFSFQNSMSLLIGAALFSSASLSAQDPVGGWYTPEWQASYAVRGFELKVVPDCTGDGLQDLCVEGRDNDWDYERIAILDGKSGEVWSEVAVPAMDRVFADVIDLDGDGVAEVIWRLPNYSDSSGDNLGKIQVLQGGTKVLLWEQVGQVSNTSLSFSLSYLDLTGNGLLDVFLWQGTPGSTARKGSDGSLLWALSEEAAHFAVEVTDISGDGVGDLLIEYDKQVDLFDAVRGTSLWAAPVSLPIQPGLTVKSDWDLSGDSIADIVIPNRGHWSGLDLNVGGICAIDAVNGQLLWFAEGVEEEEQLGTRVEAFDANGDGRLDVFSLARKSQVLYDGFTGLPIWERDYTLASAKTKNNHVLDLTGDGIDDVLLRTKQSPGVLALVDGRDGREVWAVAPPDLDEKWQTVLVGDVNGDALIDVVAGSPDSFSARGYMAVLNGADGSLQWNFQGVVTRNRVGGMIELIPSAAAVEMEVFVRVHGIDSEAGFRSLDGSNGNELWRHDLAGEHTAFHEWYFEDLNGNGRNELIEVIHSNSTQIYVVDPVARAVRNKIAPHLNWVNGFQVMGDIDGDGYRDLALLEDGHYDRPSSALAFSTMQDRYTTGLQVVGGQHSVANGGMTAVGIEAPALYRNAPYRLLMSAKGTGLTEVDFVDIPLADDFILQRTLHAVHYPDSFLAPLGRLDASAKAEIRIITTPNQLSASIAGSQLHIAVLIETEDHLPWVCSGAEFITITP